MATLTKTEMTAVIEDDIIDRSDKSTLVGYALEWALTYLDTTAAARGFAFADLNREDVAPTNIDCTCTAAVTDIVTVSIDIPTGTKITFTVGTDDGDALPAGLSEDTDYWAINQSETTIKVASSYINAWAATVVDITSTGTGTHTITAYRERLAKPS